MDSRSTPSALLIEKLAKKSNNIKQLLDEYGEKLTPFMRRLNLKDAEHTARLKIARKLLLTLEVHNDLPKKNNLRILSLASGGCDEFIALKHYYSNFNIHYVGMDIDEEDNNTTRQRYAEHQDFKILTCDVTDPKLVVDVLKTNNETTGFDLIFLRQPNIINQSDVFKSIIEKTLPVVSTKNSIVFISTYHADELKEVSNVLNKNPEYFSGLSLPLSFETGIKVYFDQESFEKKDSLEFDSYCMLITCEGKNLSLKHLYINEIKRIAAESSWSNLDWTYNEKQSILWAKSPDKPMVDSAYKDLSKYQIAEKISVGAVQHQAYYSIQIIKPKLNELNKIPSLGKLTSKDIASISLNQKKKEEDVSKALAKFSFTNDLNPATKKSDLASSHRKGLR